MPGGVWGPVGLWICRDSLGLVSGPGPGIAPRGIGPRGIGSRGFGPRGIGSRDRVSRNRVCGIRSRGIGSRGLQDLSGLVGSCRRARGRVSGSGTGSRDWVAGLSLDLGIGSWGWVGSRGLQDLPGLVGVLPGLAEVLPGSCRRRAGVVPGSCRRRAGVFNFGANLFVLHRFGVKLLRSALIGG